MIEQLLNKMKTYVLGQVTMGEKVESPKCRTVYPEDYVFPEEKDTKRTMDAFNKWSRSINFGGMYVKEQY